ncbi:MAG: HNH endonuclease [Marmoricola sp.]
MRRPFRHDDHIEEHASGGETSLANGQGPCERCNHIKQAYTSTPPAPPGNARSHWTQARLGVWTRIAA